MEEISRRRQATERTEIQRRLMEHERERPQLAAYPHDLILQDDRPLFMVNNPATHAPRAACAAATARRQRSDRPGDRRTARFFGRITPPALSKLGLKEAIAAHANSTMKKYPGWRSSFLCITKTVTPGGALRLPHLPGVEQRDQAGLPGESRFAVRFVASPMQIDDDGVGFVLPDVGSSSSVKAT